MNIQFGELSPQAIQVKPVKSIFQIPDNKEHTVSLALINNELYTAMTINNPESQEETTSFFLPLNLLNDRDRRHKAIDAYVVNVFESSEHSAYRAECRPYDHFHWYRSPRADMSSTADTLYVKHLYEVEGERVSGQYANGHTVIEKPFVLDAVKMHERHKSQNQFEALG